MSELPMLRGIVHGRTIELDQDVGLPEGQAVVIVVQPVNESAPSNDGLQQSFGAWSADEQELDEYLEWNRQQRKVSHSRSEP